MAETTIQVWALFNEKGEFLYAFLTEAQAKESRLPGETVRRSQLTYSPEQP